MQETKGLIEKIRHHEQLPILVNQNCSIPLPEDVMHKLFNPHRLSFYYFMYVEKGSASFKADLKDVSISDGQLVFGLPNQVFMNVPFEKDDQHFAVSFDETTLSMLPHSYPFLLNPFGSNTVTFDQAAQPRIKATLSTLFQLLHSSHKAKNAEIILAYLHALLTEINSAYFDNGHPDIVSNPKLSKYIAFKVAVETHLTEQQDVHAIAEQLTMTTSNLYSIVKEFSGLSPKEWMTNRLIQEAQRKLQYSAISVKELAYELGFSDPGYFSRLFKKTTGQSISDYLRGMQDLSQN